MIKEGRLRRVVLVVLLLAVLAGAWWAWFRPVGPRQGPAPVALQDGWTISSPAAEGFDARALQLAIGGVLDKPLDVHAVLVERHGRLVSEFYQGGMDRSVYALVSKKRGQVHFSSAALPKRGRRELNLVQRKRGRKELSLVLRAVCAPRPTAVPYMDLPRSRPRLGVGLDHGEDVLRVRLDFACCETPDSPLAFAARPRAEGCT